MTRNAELNAESGKYGGVWVSSDLYSFGVEV